MFIHYIKFDFCVGSSYLQGMWSFICPELLKAIDTEPENEVLAEHMHSLAKVIHIALTKILLDFI